MSRFILIDHSLKGVGGHHYEYAAHVLRAAERAGYQPVLATHRRFRGGGDYPRHWPTWPLFRFTTYSDYTIYRSRPQTARPAAGISAEGAGPVVEPTASVWTWRGLRQRIGDLCHRRGRRRRIAAFAASLDKLFSHVPLADGDQVFIPTLSELDLAGLIRHLEASPQSSRRADWHLQFHYNIFDGREPEFPAQADKLATMQAAFADALARVPTHRLFFYNTTEPLAAQYARMNLAPFAALPYPVNETLAVTAADANDGASSRAAPAPRQNVPRPLRIACLGAIRPDKGAAELARVVERLWDSHFLPGRCQLVVQSNKPRFRLPLPIDDEAELPDGVEPIVYAPHPLPMGDYVALIRSADVGLLMYDSRRYYARCSGVLVELLSVGTPVVVSAGCWMAEQIAEANFAHVDRAMRDLRQLGDHRLGSLDLPAMAHDVAAEIDVPRHATHAVCSFCWRFPSEAGTYLRLTLESLGADGDEAPPRTQIVGRRCGPQAANAMFPLAPSTTRVRLRCENAYDDGPIGLADVHFHVLSAQHLPQATYPLGAVGRIAADDEQVAPLLDEITTHWPHYRNTAADFSQAWSAYHNAGRIVDELAARSQSKAARDNARHAA